MKGFFANFFFATRANTGLEALWAQEHLNSLHAVLSSVARHGTTLPKTRAALEEFLMTPPYFLKSTLLQSTQSRVPGL